MSILGGLGGGLRDRFPLRDLVGGLRERLLLLPLGRSLEALLDWLLESFLSLPCRLREGDLDWELSRSLRPRPLLWMGLLLLLVLSEDSRLCPRSLSPGLLFSFWILSLLSRPFPASIRALSVLVSSVLVFGPFPLVSFAEAIASNSSASFSSGSVILVFQFTKPLDTDQRKMRNP